MDIVYDNHRPYYEEEDTFRYDALTNDEKQLQLELYLKGIVWIMEYFSGSCLDYSFYYPFSTGPTAGNLANCDILKKTNRT